MEKLEMLQKEEYKKIIQYIESNPGTNQKDIIQSMKFSERQLQVRLQRLVEHNIVIKKPNLQNMKMKRYFVNLWRNNQ